MAAVQSSPRSAISIRACLILTLSCLSILLLLVGVTGIVALRNGNASLETLARQHLPALEALDDSNRLLLRANTHFDAFDAAFGSGNLDAAKQSLSQGKQDLANAVLRWKVYEQAPKSEKEALLFADLSKRYSILVNDKVTRAVLALEKFDLNTYRDVSRTQVAQAFDAFEAAAAQVVKYHRDTAEQLFDDAQARLRQVLWLIGFTLALSLFVTFAASVLLNRKVNRPISTLATQMQRIAEGDLSEAIHAPARDEVGRLFDSLEKMQQGLRDIVSAVRSGSEIIHIGSGQIAAGNADLSERTEAQAAALQRAAASILQLNDNVLSNAGSADQAQKLAVGAAKSAEEGNTVATEVVASVRDIAGQARRVRDLIGVIDNIARQTGILALNAGIEAARAGDHGSGFGVVAREVGELAKRSAQAAKNAQVIIDDTDASVRDGAALAERAAQTMARIANEAGKVADLIRQISDTTAGQSSDIGGINEAVGQIEQGTARNTAMTEESAAAAASLVTETMRLNDTVRVFRLET
jgi:methyl-accepting chemotaxis protein